MPRRLSLAPVDLFLRPLFIGFFDSAFQPHLDEMQHAPVNDPARHRFKQIGMRNASEVVREVGVHDLGWPRNISACASVTACWALRPGR